jgi:dCTP deaminase
MILSDRDIARLINRRTDPLIIHGPLDGQSIQPCSIDMTLGNKMLTFESQPGLWLTTKEQPKMSSAVFSRYLLRPQEFILAATEQHFRIPYDHAAQVDGKSSLGRLGMLIHITAGWIDPGFRGNITLEICNIGPLPIEIYSGMPIAQLILYQLSSQAARPYGHESLGSKYQDSDGVQSMRPPSTEWFYKKDKSNG